MTEHRTPRDDEEAAVLHSATKSTISKPNALNAAGRRLTDDEFTGAKRTSTVNDETRTGGVAPASDELTDTALTESELTELGNQIHELTAQIDAGFHRLLELLHRFDQQRGWQGFPNCAAWLSFHCGVSPITGREWLRVARSLAELPTVSEEMRVGRLSYSKVRAITRVATPQNEENLAHTGLYTTAAQLETACRLVRRCSADADVEAGPGSSTADPESASETSSKASPASVLVDDGRWMRSRVTGSGRVRFEIEVEPEDAELIELALALGRRQLASVLCDSADTPDASAESSPSTADDASADVSSADAPAVDASADDASAEDVSAEALDQNGGAAESSQRNDSAESSEAETPHQEPTCSHGGRVRNIDAFLLLMESVLAGGEEQCKARPAASRQQLFVHLSRERTPDGPGLWGGELHDGTKICDSSLLRVACDCGLITVAEDKNGKPLDVGRATRSIPPAIRRALDARDRCCQFPGCQRQHYTEGHHIVHWAAGGETKLENLVLLCHMHHRLLHDGEFSIERCPETGELIFRNRTGQRIDTVSLVTVPAGAASLVEGNASDGAHVDLEQATYWDGNRIDWQWVSQGWF